MFGLTNVAYNKAFKRTNYSWLFVRSSLILANYNLPLNAALYAKESMSTWRRKAIEFFPEIKSFIEQSETPGCLWLELYSLLKLAVEEGNNSFVQNVLKYLTWCTSDAAGHSSNNIHQAVSCGFLEDIGGNKVLWPYFNKWFTKAQFEQYKAVLCYGFSSAKTKELENTFYGR